MLFAARVSFYAGRPRVGVGAGHRSYNGGDFTMRAIWINAVTDPHVSDYVRRRFRGVFDFEAFLTLLHVRIFTECREK
jgi:hypothetical protein